MDNTQVYTVCVKCHEGYFLGVDLDTIPCPSCNHTAPIIELDCGYDVAPDRVSNLMDAITQSYEDSAWGERIKEHA